RASADSSCLALLLSLLSPLLVILYLSMFVCASYHLVLHSFPTRRSSDLAHGGLEHQDPHHHVRGEVLDPTASTDARRPALLRAQDRKSTRLNSSHVSISYAVFCLKKKTT